MTENLQRLIQQLSSPDATQQATAAEALAHLGQEAQSAAAPLVTALRTDHESTRDWITAALEDIGPPLTTQIPELTQLAEDESLDTAYWAITLLGRAGAAAAPAVPALANVIEFSDEIVLRERAAWALGKLGPTAAAATPALRTAAASDEPRLSRLAKQALDAIGRS